MPAPYNQLSADAPKVYVDQNPKGGVETLTIILDPVPGRARERFIMEEKSSIVTVEEVTVGFRKDDYSTIHNTVENTMTYPIFGFEKLWTANHTRIRQILDAAVVTENCNLRDIWDKLLEQMQEERLLPNPKDFKP